MSRAPDCILIDKQPTLDDPAIRQTIEEATHIVLPCSPSPGDITTIGATAAVVREFAKPESKSVIEGKKPNPVINRGQKSTRKAGKGAPSPNCLNRDGKGSVRKKRPVRSEIWGSGDQALDFALPGGFEAVGCDQRTGAETGIPGCFRLPRGKDRAFRL